MSKNTRVKNHTVGEVRYFNVWVESPGGKIRTDNFPFVGDMSIEIKNRFRFDKKYGSEFVRRLVKDGTAEYKTDMGVRVTITVGETPLVRSDTQRRKIIV
jgi:hypothetical protein